MSGAFPDEMSPEELSAYRRAAKEALRKRVASLRRALNSEARAARSVSACRHVTQERAFVDARVVLGYAALRFELDPEAALDRAWALGKTVALPRVDPESGALSLHVVSKGDALSESAWGVREPLATSPCIAPEAVDLVLVPGLAFDARGYRLGFGKGFYDRLLPGLTRAVRIGLAFELSLLPEIPAEPHDVPMHFVITEKRILPTQDSLL